MSAPRKMDRCNSLRKAKQTIEATNHYSSPPCLHRTVCSAQALRIGAHLHQASQANGVGNPPDSLPGDMSVERRTHQVDQTTGLLDDVHDNLMIMIMIIMMHDRDHDDA